MANIQYQLTLQSEGVSSGPYYVVTYSTGSATYFPVINGSPAYLPDVGSTALVVITSGSYANLSFKLTNGTGGCELCNNDVIFVVTGSTPPPTPTPTASPTPTPTATPTASPTPTPTASPTPTPTASPTPSPTPSFYYYAVRQNQCNAPGACTFIADQVARSSITLSTIDGVYYKVGSYTYQVQTEITPAPMSFDVDLSTAPSDANCITACGL
jgi:hypothetical protein